MYRQPWTLIVLPLHQARIFALTGGFEPLFPSKFIPSFDINFAVRNLGVWRELHPHVPKNFCFTDRLDKLIFHSYTVEKDRIELPSRGSSAPALPTELLLQFTALEVGIEPTTYRLTAGCSTAELLQNLFRGPPEIRTQINHINSMVLYPLS